MIKAIVMDIDGVIVGTKRGYNLPLPSEKVQRILHELSLRLPISFCSAKSFAAILKIIQACDINSIHITDGGSLLHDWEFIELCGYKATLANANDDLKQMFDFNDPHQYIGGHVDDDGVIDILKHFWLI